MRTRPHPVRILWSSARILMVFASGGLVVVGLTSRSRTETSSAVLFTLAVVAAVAWAVVLLSNKAASTQGPALRFWSGTAATTILRTPEQVWAFIRPAETAPMIDPSTRRGFTVPGTPRGAGEQQVFICGGPAGRFYANVIEVMEEQPGVSAVARNVTGEPFQQSYRVEPAQGGAALTVTVELSAMRWAPYRTHPRRQAEEAARRYVEAVKRVLESQPPAAPPPAPPPPT